MTDQGIPPVIFHVDLDAFYASVEQRDDPALSGRPVIVGAAPGRRGVVSACSYEARRFGIHSAMPISQAYRRCPQGVYLPVRKESYLEVSNAVMEMHSTYTPRMQQISVDEAFLDMTGTERLFGPARDTGTRLKAEVRGRTGLAISVGIGPNKYLAKMATNAGKPDGLVEVRAEEAESFLDGVALKDLWGIGEKTLQRLTELNITSVRQLRGFRQPELSRLLGQAASGFLASVTRGSDPGIFSEEPHSRSLSSETTFEHDRKDRTGIERVLLELSHQVMFRMMEGGWKSKTISRPSAPRGRSSTGSLPRMSCTRWPSSCCLPGGPAGPRSGWSASGSRTSPPSRRRIRWSCSRTGTRAAGRWRKPSSASSRRWETAR